MVEHRIENAGVAGSSPALPIGSLCAVSRPLASGRETPAKQGASEESREAVGIGDASFGQSRRVHPRRASAGICACVQSLGGAAPSAPHKTCAAERLPLTRVWSLRRPSSQSTGTEGARTNRPTRNKRGGRVGRRSRSVVRSSTLRLSDSMQTKACDSNGLRPVSFAASQRHAYAPRVSLRTLQRAPAERPRVGPRENVAGVGGRRVLRVVYGGELSRACERVPVGVGTGAAEVMARTNSENSRCSVS